MPVHYEEHGRVAAITIEGIGRYNLFSPEEVYEPLVAALERVRDDPEMWTALIQAPAEKHVFTYGGHIGAVDRLKNTAETEDRGYKFAKAERLFRTEDKSLGIQSWRHVLHFNGMKIYKPVVFAVNGPCIGAGTLLVNSLADYVVAVDSTYFGLLELRWGIGQGGGAAAQMRWDLPWRIAMDMVLRGRKMDAEEALRYGFINEIVPREELTATAMAVVEDFASMPPLGVQASKRLAIMSREMPMEASRWVSDLYTALIGDTTHDAKEGPRAFVEKRKPVFTGKLGNLRPEDPI